MIDICKHSKMFTLDKEWNCVGLSVNACELFAKTLSILRGKITVGISLLKETTGAKPVSSSVAQRRRGCIWAVDMCKSAPQGHTTLHL